MGNVVNIKLAISFLSAISSAVAIYKVIAVLMLKKQRKIRDEYSLSKEFLTDFYTHKNSEKLQEHSYALEKGFLALTGKLYPFDEINLLLSQPSPSKAISQRNSSLSFLLFRTENQTYEWKGIYNQKSIRKLASVWFFACYALLAFAALFPISLIGVGIYNMPHFDNLPIVPLFIFCTSLLVLAILSLNQYINLSSAKEFMGSIQYKLKMPNYLLLICRLTNQVQHFD